MKENKLCTGSLLRSHGDLVADDAICAATMQLTLLSEQQVRLTVLFKNVVNGHCLVTSLPCTFNI